MSLFGKLSTFAVALCLSLPLTGCNDTADDGDGAETPVAKAGKKESKAKKQENPLEKDEDTFEDF